MTANDERIVPLRLQKFLARAGVASRRGSENLMTEGRVSVNGIVVTELGSRIDPSVDEVMVDGKRVYVTDTSTSLIFYKPAGYITTMSDPHGRPTVAELVPTKEYPGLYPVGRLDADTTGILLFSTDGELGNNLLHPSKQVNKIYEATVLGVPSEDKLDMLRKGVLLEDGMTAPARVSLKEKKEESIIEIDIHEGRKRQVKRMFDLIGYPILQLHRRQFGPLKLDGLEEGQWRILTQEERESLEKLIC